MCISAFEISMKNIYAKYLRGEFGAKFSVGKYSTKLIKEATKGLKCSICDGSRPLPKKQHVESIFTYGPFRRMQMDASQIASEKLKRFRVLIPKILR